MLHGYPLSLKILNRVMSASRRVLQHSPDKESRELLDKELEDDTPLPLDVVMPLIHAVRSAAIRWACCPTLGIWYCWWRVWRHCQTQLRWKRQQI